MSGSPLSFAWHLGIAQHWLQSVRDAARRRCFLNVVKPSADGEGSDGQKEMGFDGILWDFDGILWDFEGI